MTPTREAAQIFQGVVNELSAPNPDLKNALRRCLHACQILGWPEATEWFDRELNGYPVDATLPYHRWVKARLAWELSDYPDPMMQAMLSKLPGYANLKKLPVENIRQDLIDNIDWILLGSQLGYAEYTGEIATVPSLNPKGTAIAVSRVKRIDASAINVVRQRIEHYTFEFASRYYAQLTYGEALTDLWQGYRQVVDQALAKLALSDHLSSIQQGIQSANAQDHRAVVYGYRNLLEDMAAILWQDPRETYSLLPGDGRNKQLKVTKDRFANRLRAYLHQQGIWGNRGKYFASELDRLSDSIRALIALEGAAHASLTPQDARSVALATYFLVGTLATYTDLEPVAEYRDLDSSES